MVAEGWDDEALLAALRQALRARQASVVVVNGVPEHASLLVGKDRLAPTTLHMSLQGGEAYRLDGLAGPQSLQHFSGKRAHAVAGIGNPSRFFRDLRARGIDVIEHPYPDHHPFVAADLTFDDDLPVLMTQKDAVRCRSLANPRLWYVPVVARFGDAEGRELLDQVIRSLGP